ncbi:hypothetical protein BT63DRAFT_420986 [Microthyrium microscopicum]|uniref:Heterokaryon incompatibility domain-containing protein n=1 Tax=Microthyrium microscopicum TaxID=703497 RepID=A0A6A6UKK4_9PEZI|nr:hypothetical protein BT63DRAFT_420986 [Microthyrium microscopicum]
MGQISYSPLSVEKKEIRLLTLFSKPTVIEDARDAANKALADLSISGESHPADGFQSQDESKPCGGSLTIVSLNDNPEYEALSYVWGDENLKSTFILDGVEVKITENLAVALRHLEPTEKPLVLWIDAICINQSDNVEKSHQVSQMKDIYSAATSVTVWLGPFADGSDYVMSQFEKFDEKFDVFSDSNTTTLVGLVRQAMESGLTTLEQICSPVVKQTAAQIEQLFNREWWYRVWSRFCRNWP